MQRSTMCYMSIVKWCIVIWNFKGRCRNKHKIEMFWRAKTMESNSTLGWVSKLEQRPQTTVLSQKSKHWRILEPLILFNVYKVKPMTPFVMIIQCLVRTKTHHLAPIAVKILKLALVSPKQIFLSQLNLELLFKSLKGEAASKRSSFKK